MADDAFVARVLPTREDPPIAKHSALLSNRNLVTDYYIKIKVGRPSLQSCESIYLKYRNNKTTVEKVATTNANTPATRLPVTTHRGME